MNKRNRDAKLAIGYRRAAPGEWACVYCGADWTEMDHCPPLSLALDYPDAPRLLVPSCGDCNSWLSNRKLLTLHTRKTAIEAHLTQRRSVRRIGIWETAELEELGGSLRREVEAKIAADARFDRRLLGARAPMPDLFWSDDGDRVPDEFLGFARVPGVVNCARCGDPYVREDRRSKYCSNACRSKK